MGMSKYYVRSGLRCIDYECILFLLLFIILPFHVLSPFFFICFCFGSGAGRGPGQKPSWGVISLRGPGNTSLFCPIATRSWISTIRSIPGNKCFCSFWLVELFLACFNFGDSICLGLRAILAKRIKKTKDFLVVFYVSSVVSLLPVVGDLKWKQKSYEKTISF